MNKSKKWKELVWLLVLILPLIVLSYAPAAEKAIKAEEFYKGKTVDFSITSSAGGLTDLTGRLLASYLQKHTGVTCVIGNRRAAGGSEGAIHTLSAKPDGLRITGSSFTWLTFGKIMEEPIITFELGEIAWLWAPGAMPTAFMVAANGPYTTIAALKAGKNLKFGAGAPGTNVCLGAATVVHILGLDAKVVPGFAGSSAVLLSVQQGESAGCAYSLATVIKAVEAGTMKPMFIVGTKRHPALPDVPALSEVVSLGQREKEILRFWDEELFETHPSFTSSKVPKDRVAFLRQVCSKISELPQFQAELQKILGYDDYPIMTGEELTKATNLLIKDKEKIKALFDDIWNRYKL